MNEVCAKLGRSKGEKRWAGRVWEFDDCAGTGAGSGWTSVSCLVLLGEVARKAGLRADAPKEKRLEKLLWRRACKGGVLEAEEWDHLLFRFTATSCSGMVSDRTEVFPEGLRAWRSELLESKSPLVRISLMLVVARWVLEAAQDEDGGAGSRFRKESPRGETMEPEPEEWRREWRWKGLAEVGISAEEIE